MLGLGLTRPRSRTAAAPWLALVGVVAATAGLLLGAARLHAIDSGAYVARPGSEASLRGHVTAVPRRSRGEVRIRADTADGRIAILAPEPVPDLAVGAEVIASGTIAQPRPG